MKLSRILPRLRLHSITTVAITGGVAALLLWSLPTQAPSGSWEMPTPVVTLGASFGLTYGLLAVGLVIVYRSSKVINFAHGEIGAFATAVFGLVTIKWQIPYWIGLAGALAVGAAVAASTEVLVVRRLQRAPRLMSIVATLGVGQFLFILSTLVFEQAGAAHLFPDPPGFPDFMVGTLRVSPAHSGMFVLSPILLVALGLFLKRSRFGIAIRCASATPDVARMVGVFASRMSSLAWALAGVGAAFTAIITQPTRGFTGAESFGPSLLLLGLAAAVLARMASIPIAVISGLAIGILEQLLVWNFRSSGAVEIVLFALILSALLIQRKRSGREDDRSDWSSVQAIRPLPEQFREVWFLRNLGRLSTSITLGAALALPFIISSSAAVTLTAIIGFAIVALSIGVITGMGGQLTLGQFAFAGIGAVVSYHVSMRTGWFPLAFVYAGVAAALIAVLVGLPALRIRGLLATVTTLAFALAAPAALFGRPWLLGDGVNPGRPIVFGHEISSGSEYYFVGLFVLVLVIAIVHNVRNSGFGRLLIAVRDNEENSRAFTVSATKVKILGFMCAGFVAGIGGAVYGHLLSNIASDTFPVTASIDVAKIAVIGGISMTAGPLLGALFVMGIPAFVPLATVGLLATSFGQLLVIMYLPKGLVQVVVPLRNLIARYLGRRAGIDVDAAPAVSGGAEQGLPCALGARESVASLHARAGRSRGEDNSRSEVMLRATNLHRKFGGVQAVKDTSFDVHNGEIVGLIGPNGAGKTTTFDIISGFIRPDKGTVLFEERDVTLHSPESRGRYGIIRSFQDAALFPTMTVEEVIMLAGERLAPSSFFASVAGITKHESVKRERARAVIELMGLESFRRKQIMELSTGTRRITELACLITLRPKLLLLDEPSSGIAQRETEALGTLLRNVKREFNFTMLIIEHDIPMITNLADRIVAMTDGRVVAVGTPGEIRRNPVVIESYLGADKAVIERSGRQEHQQVG